MYTMATAFDTRDLMHPVGYMDLRRLVDINPPQYEYDIQPYPPRHKKKEVKEAQEKEPEPEQVPDISTQTQTTFDDEFPLDNEAWARVPPGHVVGRFRQYRNLSLAKITQLEKTNTETINRTVKKINTLKAQFHEHKDKWLSERTLLVEQVNQADHSRAEAEHEADTALNQLENFVNEQEKLELEEDVRRAELEEQASGIIASSGASLEEAKAKLALLERKREEELLERNLLDQTDDAKAELNRLASGTVSKLSDDQPEDKSQQPLLTPQSENEADGWFPSYKQSVLDSISGMLESETLYAENQQRALYTIRKVLLANTCTPSVGLSNREIGDEIQTEYTSEAGATAAPAAPAIPPYIGKSQIMRSLSNFDELMTMKEVGQTRTLYTLAAHFALETERLGVDPASMYHALAMLYTESLTELKTEGNMLFSIPMEDSVAYDKLRKVFLSTGSSIARTRTSQRRSAVESLRASAKDRRSKSPTIRSFLSQKSVLSAELDEEGGMPFPIETQEMGTSPMTPTDLRSRISTQMFEHPVVQQFLRCYDSVLSFKDMIAQCFADRDQMSTGEGLNDIEAITFDESEMVQPQIERMSTSIIYVLEEAARLVNDALNSDLDQEYPVSAFNMSSGDPSRILMTRERTPQTRESTTRQDTGKSRAQLEHAAKEMTLLREQCESLTCELSDKEKHHQDEIQHNTVLMMEMQNTISNLRHELAALAKKEEALETQQPHEEPPVMFTRLDSERNAKVMKRAVGERRLETINFENAVEAMNEYVNLPAKRFVHLVHKYVHHRQMKQIEDNVSKSRSLNDDVFHILDKMETLQSTRAQKWTDKMDMMGEERLRLANLLMESLDDIERQSGIFLIKPMFSYRGNNNKKFTLSNKNNFCGGKKMASNFSYNIRRSVPPMTTPASNTPKMGADSGNGYNSSTRPLTAVYQQGTDEQTYSQPAVVGEYARSSWNPGLSYLNRYGAVDEKQFMQNSYLNTPRLLELDINRMLIGQNQMSYKVVPGLAGDDRINYAAQNNMRSYITVNRPSGNLLPKVSASKAGKGSLQTKVSTDNGLRQHNTSEGTKMYNSSSPPLPPISPHTADVTENYKAV